VIEKNVMKVDEYKDSITFRIACDCGDPEHDTTIDFEKDKDLPTMYFMTISKNMAWSCYWKNNNWFDAQWRKLKAIFKLFFTGYIELGDDFIIKGEEHIDSFIKALEEGKRHMKGETSENSSEIQKE